MAGKAAKAFKVAFGAAAGVAAGAGAYYLGKQAGVDEARAVVAATSTGRAAGSKTAAPAGRPFLEDMPRPAMQVPAEEVPRVAHDRQAYHSLINDRARDLRARIAEQAYETVLAEAESNAKGQLQAEGVEVVEGEPSTKDSKDDPTVPMTSEPYERIQDALKTTKLFSEEGEDAYKPTPFSMPKD